MKVQCKTQHCGAIGEGETYREAVKNVDHAIALSRSVPAGVPRGCPGGDNVEYEIIEGRPQGASKRQEPRSTDSRK